MKLVYKSGDICNICQIHCSFHLTQFKKYSNTLGILFLINHKSEHKILNKCGKKRWKHLKGLERKEKRKGQMALFSREDVLYF